MNTKIDNLAKRYSSSIFHNALGAYAKGAARDVVGLSRQITPRVLGERICSYNREQDVYSPFSESGHIQVSESSERINYIHNLVNYGIDLLQDTADKLNYRTTMSESSKIDILRNKAKEISKDIGRIAYGEGMIDDELKQNIQILLKEGKEQFEKRAKESEAQAPIEQAEIKGPETGQEQPGMQDGMDQGFDDGFDMIGDDNQEEFSNDDLGFDNDFGTSMEDQEKANKPSEMQNQFEQATAGMDNFNDGFASKGESLTSSDVMDYIEKHAFSEADIESLLTNINTYRMNSRDYFSHVGNGVITTMTKTALNNSINELLSFEESFFNKVAAAEGANELELDKYSDLAKYSINEMATILAVRDRLNI